VHFSHRKAAHRLRFARIVADYFDTWEVTHYKNGGNINAIIEYWRNHAFQTGDRSLIGKEQDPTYRSYDPCDIGYFVLQCTEPSRTVSHIKSKSGEELQRWQVFEQCADELKAHLDQQQITLDQYMDQCKQEDVAAYKNLLEYIESLGIKTLIMSWPENLLKYIGLDEWLSSRLIKFDYLGTTYNSIERLIDANPSMTLSTDYQNFETPPTDDHPSLLCHRVIAQGVIEKIKEIK
jgi:hypothetical protein